MFEVLTSAAVVAVSMGIAVPAVTHVLAQNQRATAVNQLQLALLSARQMAVARNAAMTFCAGNPNDGCHGDWARKEWLVFADRDRDGQVDRGEALVLIGTLPTSLAIAVAGNGPFRRAIVFRDSGRAETVTGAFAAGRLRVCVKQAIAGNTVDLVLIGSGRAEPEPHDFAGSCPAP